MIFVAIPMGRIHYGRVRHIFTDPWMLDFYFDQVGKYTVHPMDGMGLKIYMKSCLLVGGWTTHFEQKYVRQIGSFPQVSRDAHRNISIHHPAYILCLFAHYSDGMQQNIGTKIYSSAVLWYIYSCFWQFNQILLHCFKKKSSPSNFFVVEARGVAS